MPFYQAIFGDHFRFLHVIRDGRDVAYGDNQMQFWMLCEKHYSASFCDRTKTDHHVASMQFWQDVNIQAYHLATSTGSEGLGLGGRYMVLRVEDLARPNNFAGTLARLLDFAGGDSPIEEKVSESLELKSFFDPVRNLSVENSPSRADGYILGAQSLENHSERLKKSKNFCASRLRPGPYEGAKYSDIHNIKKNRRELSGRSSKISASEVLETLGSTGQHGLEFFGYTADTWGRFRDPPGRVWEMPARREIVNLIGRCGFDTPYRSDYMARALPETVVHELKEETEHFNGNEAIDSLHLSSFADDEIDVLEKEDRIATHKDDEKQSKKKSQSNRIADALFNGVKPHTIQINNGRMDIQTNDSVTFSQHGRSFDHPPSHLSRRLDGNLIGAFKNDCSMLKHTFKNAPHCESLSHSSHVYPLLVTGVGRSATKYMADELVALGAQVSHDNSEVGRHGAVAWPLAIRETGHLDPELHDDGELAGHGMNGYELPSFLHNTARTVIGRNPSARFSIILHQVRLLEIHNYSTLN